jgi:hypothetical protein
MCTYQTSVAAVTGSGKGEKGWFRLTHAMAYFDHPYFSPYEHTLNLDFVNDTGGPSSRVAIELTPASARELIACIESALATASAGTADAADAADAAELGASSVAGTGVAGA